MKDEVKFVKKALRKYQPVYAEIIKDGTSRSIRLMDIRVKQGVLQGKSLATGLWHMISNPEVKA